VTESRESTKLAFLPPEDWAPGMRVHEIDLAPSGSHLTPFKSSRFEVEAGCSSPVDQHEVREIWFIAQGEGELTYDGVPMRIRAGEVCCFEPRKPHAVVNDGASTLVVFSVWWG
jgi:mannose-6-phosphate isomerase-like protein (cupin superfamily)